MYRALIHRTGAVLAFVLMLGVFCAFSAERRRPTIKACDPYRAWYWIPPVIRWTALW